MDGDEMAQGASVGERAASTYRIPGPDSVATTGSGDNVFMSTTTRWITFIDMSPGGVPVRDFGKRGVLNLPNNAEYNGQVLLLPGPAGDVSVIEALPHSIVVHLLAA